MERRPDVRITANDDGPHGLSFGCDTMADAAIRAAGHEPNGYFWEGVVQFAFPRAASVDMDAEGSMFFAYGDESTLRDLKAFLTPLLTDGEVTATLIARADDADFVFDD